MAYTPPAWNAVDFAKPGVAYSPPDWDEVDFPNLPGFNIATGSAISFAGATPVANATLTLNLASTISLAVLAGGRRDGSAWDNPWTVSGTTLDWKSSFEKQRDFTSAPKSTVLWKARFEAGTDMSLAPASAVAWKSATIVNVPAGCSCPPYCPTPRYATQGRFTSQCRTRVCIKWCSC